MNMEVLREGRHRHRDLRKQFLANSSRRQRRRCVQLLLRNRAHRFWHKDIDTPLQIFESLLQLHNLVLPDFLDFRLCEGFLANQSICIDLANRWMFADFLVQQRLRVAGIIGLIVSVAPIAEHVNDYVLLKLPPKLISYMQDTDGGFRIVSIYVKY